MTDPFRPSPEIAAIVGRWLVNYGARRAAAATSPFSRSAALSYVGTDAGEVFDAEAMRHAFAAFTDGQAKLLVEDVDAVGWEAGAVGWARATYTVLQPEANKRSPMRSSFVLSLEDGIWRIVHVHNSTPTPNIEAMGYESRSLQELAGAVETRRLEIAETGIASIMFTDIVDSTPLAAAAGDAAWSRIVRDHVALVTDRVEAAGGTLAKSLGDGTLSSFASARGAMEAACGIQRANAALDAEPRLHVRIGLHTGDLVRTGDDVLGGVVNKAARIAAAAAPDEIRVSEATRLMGGDGPGLAFEDPVHAVLKGLEGEHLLHRLVWRSAETAPCDA
jgi:class 3 adenylate cyclase